MELLGLPQLVHLLVWCGFTSGKLGLTGMDGPVFVVELVMEESTVAGFAVFIQV